MNRARLHDIYSDQDGSEQPSVVKCIEQLCSIHIKKNPVCETTYSKPRVQYKRHLKQLKKNAFDTLYKSQKNAPESFPGQLLSSDEWTERSVVEAAAYRMRTRQRRYHDADRLEELARKLLEDGNENTAVLRLLLCLSNLENPSKHHWEPLYREAPKREEISKIAKLKGPLYAGDYPYHIYHKTYTLYPSWYFHKNNLDVPLMYPQKNSDVEQDLLHAKQYKPPRLSGNKNIESLFGLKSEVFGYKGLTNSTYEFDSVSRLYGGLRHSRTSTLDITLSYPKITGPIDMLASIVTPMSSIDEGFVSPSASIEFSSDFEQDLSPRSPSHLKDDFASMPVPYHGYRFPNYDLNIWNDCLTVKKNSHRTWETLGLPGGSTQRRLYLTEAGSKIFDQIWQQRAKVIHNLASFLTAGTLVHFGWKEMEQRQLVKDATLVMMGVASDTFQFNKLGQMFLPCKNLYFSGVDPDALHSLLSCFAEWGTCFWRLLRFSSSSIMTPPRKIHDPFRFLHQDVPSEEVDKKGAVFKSFSGAVRNYLLEFQHQILAMDLKYLTLQELKFKVRRAASQIRYICQLCQCGTPDMPSLFSDGKTEFPSGVTLLSYLYEEAVHCPEPNHYLALLYLLRKSFLPYLQFVQDWVFRGKCWDAYGEFMLKVNADFGGARKDRLRWLKYVEPATPDNPGSSVPSFLSSMANEIYTCGKTVDLIQFICPGHFLGVNGLDSPDLELTFSRRKLQSIEYKWKRHEDKMTQLEKDRIINWMQKESDLKVSAHEVAVSARKAAEEERVRAKDIMRQEWVERDKVKRKEFERLKKQAEDDVKRRAQEKTDEKEEDMKREENRKAEEKEKTQEEDRMLLEEKQKMISYYEELNKEAEHRLLRSQWATRRYRLHSERIKHDAQQKVYWANELKRKLLEKRVESEIHADEDVLQDAVVEEDSQTKGVILEDLINFDSVDEILQDFVNVTIDSQLEHLQTSPEKKDSDLDVALKIIGGSEAEPEVKFQAGVIGQGHDLPHKLHIAPGLHHVSEETTSAPQIRPHIHAVEGKGVTHSNLNMGMAPAEEGSAHTSTRLVGGKRITDTTLGDVFTFEKGVTPEFKYSVRNVDGKNISDSNIGNLMGLQSGSEAPNLPPKLGKKQVAGHKVGDTSLGDMSTPMDTTSKIRMVQDKRVSDSHMGQILGATQSPMLTQTTLKKQVPGQGVTFSSMGELMSGQFQTPQLNKVTPKDGVHGSVVGELLYGTQGSTDPYMSGRQVKGHSVSDSSVFSNLSIEGENAVKRKTRDSTLQDLLYGQETATQADEMHRKKKVEGRHMSDSTIGEYMKLNQMNSEKGVYLNKDINSLRKFAIQNRTHTGHHSQSTIQDLVYYEDSGPEDWEKAKVGSITRLKLTVPPDLRPAINSPKFHPSYSTVQLLLDHGPSSEEQEDEYIPTDKTFHLQLPPMDVYSEFHLNMKGRSKDSDKEKELKPIDLIGNVIGKSLERSFEDDIVFEEGVDWRSDIDAVEMHALPVLLGHCVIQPIMEQVSLANRCIVNYFMVDLELPRHFEMLRHFCFMEDGEFSHVLSTQLFEKIHSGCRPIELLNPIALGSLISQAIQGSAQRNSPHAEKLTFSIQHLPAVFSTNDPSSLHCFMLKYDIGWPCNIVVTESCEKRYGLVFGFLLKLKHIMWCLHDVGTKLTSMGHASNSNTAFTDYELRRLHLYRHEMQNFVKVMQGYVSTQVVHVCWHEFQDSLKNVKCLDDIHKVHTDYLHRCVFRCLLTKKTITVMNVITDVFKTILRFWTQISSHSVSFSQLKQTYSNFQKYSTFLFKVVSKLVDRGYQPHLEDFLIRLNYNGFYNEYLKNW